MSKLLRPDIYASTFDKITPEIIKNLGAKAIFVDLDGTLVSKNVLKPTELVLAWIKNMLENDIKVVILSNNKKERVGNFCKDIGVPYFNTALKPLKSGFQKSLNELNHKVKASEVVMIGDQIYTDTLVAKRMGAKSIFVESIDAKSGYAKFRKQVTEKRFVESIKERI